MFGTQTVAMGLRLLLEVTAVGAFILLVGLATIDDFLLLSLSR